MLSPQTGLLHIVYCIQPDCLTGACSFFKQHAACPCHNVPSHRELLGTVVPAQPLLIPRSTSRVAVLLIGEREYAMDPQTTHVQHAVTFTSTILI